MREKPLYTMYLRNPLVDEPPATNRVFKVDIIGKFDNTRPGAEWDFVYNRPRVYKEKRDQRSPR